MPPIYPSESAAFDPSDSEPTLAIVEITLDGIDDLSGSGVGSALSLRPEGKASSTDPTLAMPLRPRALLEPEEMALGSADLSLVTPASPRGAAEADPLLGRVVAERYRILELLGRGGMGAVYKVEHTRIGKLLAMKLLSGELAQNAEAVRRFKREALTVSRLQSPNTVQVFDFGVSDGLTYLVMELVRGQTLGQVVRSGPLPFARAARIVVQVLSSLAEAHEKGIVHRDVKPENVMLVSGEGGADVAKVLDFGLAKLREAESDVTGQGVIMGTPNYMSPEQVRGEPVDARSDVYAVGALLYRLLTGQPPFRGDAALSVLNRHLYEIPVPPAERAPQLGIPPGISRAVMRALRKRPEDRFARAEDLRAVLVEELRAQGSASVDNLLDPERLRRLAPAGAAPATRDDVDAYERRLRRQRYGALVAGAALVLGGAAAGAGLLVPRAPRYAGVEVEPNNTAAEATPLGLGQPVVGQLGKRLDATRGDRDFYAFDLPGGALALRLSGLPSMATCVMLYRSGFPEPVGRYCVGRPGRDLVIPALAAPPGRYFAAVLQDLDPHGGPPPPVQESISDSYSLLVEPAAPAADAEVEPNDQAASSTRLAPGQTARAALGWARDEDVFCVADGVAGRVRWTVRAGFRESGVLEVTPLSGGREGAAVRVHAPVQEEEIGRRSEADVVGAWVSRALPAAGGDRCLRVRLAGDPWMPERGGPSGGGEPYWVGVEAAP